LDAITSKLGDKESRNGINKIFDLFDEEGTNTINLTNLKKVARELGESMSVEEL
jgi:Ca2+-binding EF-hand superfamily protein